MVTPSEASKMDEVLTDYPTFTRSILGTADPRELARRLNAFCEFGE